MATIVSTSARTSRDAGIQERPLAFEWLERLIWIGIAARTLHAIEFEIRRDVAAVAGLGQLVVRRVERSGVLFLNRCSQRIHGAIDHARNDVLQAHRRVLVRRVELDGVIEPFGELVELVGCKPPVAGLARKPQLDVAHLLQAHDLAKPWNEWFASRRYVLP